MDQTGAGLKNRAEVSPSSKKGLSPLGYGGFLLVHHGKLHRSIG